MPARISRIPGPENRASRALELGGYPLWDFSPSRSSLFSWPAGRR